ncbi:MAG: alpha/beta hydrolase [Devosia sp.]
MAQSRQLTTDDGVRIGYVEAGPADGPAVVLCHGICAAARQFEADIAYFAGLGYRVIAPDLRAHGTSGSPPAAGGDFSIDRMARDMLAVLDDAGIAHVHWVGNSLGGIIGLAMLRDVPQRFASFATFGTAYRLGLPGVAPRVMPMLYRAFGPGLLGRMTAAMTTSNPAGQKLIAEMIAGFDPGPGERIAAAVCAYDLAAAAQNYAGPVLVLRGGKDSAVNLALGHTFAAMAQHPDFQRIDLARAGHCANLDVPDELRGVLQAFWRRAGAVP